MILKNLTVRLIAASLMLMTGCRSLSQAPQVPAAPTGPDECAVGQSYSFTATTTDPNGDSIAFQFMTGDTSDWSNFVASGESVSIRKSWATVGNYTVVVRAKDSKDNISGWSAPHAVLVRTNEAPTRPVPPAGPSSGIMGTSYTFTATTTDPDGDALQFRFSWGNGDTSDWTDAVESGRSASASYTWNAPGYFQVTVQAIDKLGAVSNWSEPIGIVITSTAYPYTIALTWGQHPRDLDSHIWTPDIEGQNYHVYYGYKGRLSTAPYCSLDVDDVSSYGPEHITISQPFAGEYVYAVHHFSGDSTITTSNAKVELYVNGVLSRTFNVPDEPAAGRRWWHVFKLNGSTGAITELNIISNSAPSPTDVSLPDKSR